MAYKVFSNGDALTGSELNTYLMNQSVMVFATTTARDAALTTPSEGMLVWLQDSDKYVKYNGSAWADLITPAAPSFNRNAIINGGFDIWQRGTSVNFGAVLAYGPDRFQIARSGWTSGATISRQTGTTGIRYAARVQRDSGNTSTAGIELGTTIETSNSLPFAGETTTLSFYARAGANYSSASSALSVKVYTGTGTDQSYVAGFTGSVTALDTSATLTTSWQRFTYNVSIGSTATEIGIGYGYTPVGTAGAADYFEITGIQFESGSTATTFKRNGDSIQGELAACQRYYWRTGSESIYERFFIGLGLGSTGAAFQVQFPVTMRIAPTSGDSSSANLFQFDDGTNQTTVSSVNTLTDQFTTRGGRIIMNASSGLTQYRPYFLRANNSTSAYLGWSAEL